MTRRPPRSPLFPYAPLFRSHDFIGAPAPRFLLIHGHPLLEPNGDLRLEPDEFPENDVPHFMRQGGIKKSVRGGKTTDDPLTRGHHAFGPHRVLADLLEIFGVVVNVNLGPLVPSPALVARKTHIARNLLVIILGHFLNAFDKIQRRVFVINNKMIALTFLPFLFGVGGVPKHCGETNSEHENSYLHFFNLITSSATRTAGSIAKKSSKCRSHSCAESVFASLRSTAVVSPAAVRSFCSINSPTPACAKTSAFFFWCPPAYGYGIKIEGLRKRINSVTLTAPARLMTKSAAGYTRSIASKNVNKANGIPERAYFSLRIW